jgi:hypothetical protein
MNTIKLFIICLMALCMSSESIAQTTFTVKEQLEKINKYWIYNNCDDPVLKERTALKTEMKLIQTHLTLVEKHLRNKHIILTETQKKNRLLCLDILQEYSKRGVFPINLYHSSRTPYFIDNFGTACAVGQLIISTGHEDLAKNISRENNYEYIENLNYPELLTWADNYGFTLDELKWIQPGYCFQGPPCELYTQRNVSCFGGNDGCIGTFSGVVSLSPPYTRSWYRFDTVLNIWASISRLCDLTAGTYKCVVTNVTGDTEDLIFLISQPDPVSVLLTATNDNGFIPSNVVCKGDTVTLRVHDSLNTCGNSYHWFKNGNLSDTLSTDSIFVVTPDSTTTYEVHACSCTEILNITLSVIDSPTVISLGNDTVLCADDTLLLSAPYGYNYLWQDSSFDSVFTVTEQGIYFVEISNLCGSASDTVQINYQTPPVISLGNDTVLCADDTLLLSAPYGYDYLWQDGSLDSVFTVTEQGTYFVEISNLCGSASDTVQITYQAPPTISLGNDTVLCAGDTLLLSAPYGHDYLWQDGSFDSVFTVTQQGTCFVQVNNQCGSASDTVEITYQTPPVISLGNDTVLCVGDTFQLYVPSNDYSLLWQDGSTDTVFSLTSSGTYWLSASNICGTNSDTIKLDFSYPFVDIGQDTVVCNNTNISFDAGVWSSYEWSTGANVPTISLSGQDTLLAIWLTVEDEYGCIATDTISVVFDPCLGSQSQEIFSDISIFPNPAKNEINIHIKNYDNSPFYCKIINPQGQLVKTFEITNPNYLLNTHDIASGLYDIIIENKNQRINKKMVIVK